MTHKVSKAENKRLVKWMESGIEDIAYNDKSWFNHKMKDLEDLLSKKKITDDQALNLYRKACEEGGWRWERASMERLAEKKGVDI